MKPWRLVKIVALLGGLLLTAALVARLGPHTISAELADAGPRSLWLLAAYAAGTTLGALPWHVLLPDAVRPSVTASILSRFAASAANSVLPFAVTGEPVRLLWLRPEARAIGFAAIIVDRLAYAVASALFLFAGAIAAVRLAVLPADYAIAAAAVGVALFAGAGLVIWFAVRHRISVRIERLLGRLRKRAVPEAGFGDAIDRALADLVRHRRRLVIAVGISLLARIVLGLEVYAGFRVVGVTLSVDEALAFAAVPVFLSVAGAVVPNQLGIQEGSQAVIASALGIPAASAVAVVLLQRIRQVVTALFALVVVATVRRGQRPIEIASR
ncbi:MAG TPA: lysylphosphatidylglycerol synthase transmembrane domain-containing protein [Kofleriaceae bacterium]|jgi:uncharacterized protein (TIRG00374 family)|nr:lysylphosphatidylglycerol synthase transmembrane domain-containing protein [Kofleriaceae bacterium]